MQAIVNVYVHGCGIFKLKKSNLLVYCNIGIPNKETTIWISKEMYLTHNLPAELKVDWELFSPCIPPPPLVNYCKLCTIVKALLCLFPISVEFYCIVSYSITVE